MSLKQVEWSRWRASGGTRYYATQPNGKWPCRNVATINPPGVCEGGRKVTFHVPTVKHAKAIIEHLVNHGLIGEGADA